MIATQSPVQRTRSRGGQDPRSCELSPRPDGLSFGALSSRGDTIYTVRVWPRLSCTCPGFQARSSCYHSSAAMMRYTRACALCRATITRNAANVIESVSVWYCVDAEACDRRSGITRYEVK